MKTLEESIVAAMDGSDTRLVAHLPYILQDLWEIGTASDLVLRLVRKHLPSPSQKRILDLGCGKGTVSIKLAKELGCLCLGVDAIEAFITEAKDKAREWQVERLCRFQVGDIRNLIQEYSNYDVIVLGAIGPVFGDYLATLSLLGNCLNEGGLFIIDDSYHEEEKKIEDSQLQTRNSILNQIHAAGMKLVDEVLIAEKEVKNSDAFMFNCIRQRCLELTAEYPNQKILFENYIREQEEENEVLEEQVVSAVLVIGKV